MKTSLSVLALILTSIGAQAAEIYGQPPAAGSTGFVSSTDFNGGSNLESFVIESFTPATTQTLREIQWRGTRTISAPVDFKISISASLTSPGTVWHTNNAANETPTDTPGVYDYKFTLPTGLVLTGGQGYTLQIIGLVNNYSPYTGAYWAWSAGTGGNNIHLAQVPAVTGDFRIASVAGDTAFTLLNAATVPVAIAVQALPAAGGNVTGGGTFNPGDSVTVTATPAVSRAFINWTENGVVVSASASYTFAADGSKTLSANFTGPNTGPYVVTATAVPNGTGNVGGAGTFTAGETVSLDASPQDPYPFVSWTENGNVVSTSLVYNFTANADRNLQANFTIDGGSIAVVGTPVPANGGTVSVVGSPGIYANTFIGGSSVTLTATPAPGYHFVNWKQNADAGGPLRIVGTASPTFTYLVAYSSFLTANFEANNPILTLGVTPVGSGTVTGAGGVCERIDGHRQCHPCGRLCLRQLEERSHGRQHQPELHHDALEPHRAHGEFRGDQPHHHRHRRTPGRRQRHWRGRGRPRSKRHPHSDPDVRLCLQQLDSRRRTRRHGEPGDFQRERQLHLCGEFHLDAARQHRAASGRQLQFLLA
jgi:hypothetical protein